MGPQERRGSGINGVGGVWGVGVEGVGLVLSVAQGGAAMGCDLCQEIHVCPKESMGWDRNWLGIEMEWEAVLVRGMEYSQCPSAPTWGDAVTL